MEYYNSYYEARQHLNLSEKAFEIIENDKSVFLEKPSRQRIINIILRNYMDSADAAIDIATKRYREYILSQLSSVPDENVKNDIISALIDSYRLICCDPGANYHYLVGMVRKAGASFPEHVASYRISRISMIKRSHSRSGKITTIQAQEIDQKLNSDGVQFLLQDSEPICVRLTEQGKRMYDSQAHLRPFFSERKKLPDGSWLYSFDCTQMQAEFYFFKFGADATIEHPLELKEKFLGKYRDAVERYTKNGGAE